MAFSRNFLKMIGVTVDIANRDAEGIEHHLHPQSLQKLEEFIRTIKGDSRMGKG